MECTQRLECTQELHETLITERVCPEQVGFLGICGKTYPVVHGPNKIGRDPQTCNIVLNLNSVSRQHAVINILNKTDFMLMDLDSANKTKLQNKTLQAYIPQPLKNGDTVQFGEIFGIFRLLEENDDLPMTQAIDVPETPVFSKHMSRLNKAPITTVPESPDVSDRDDSFIIASQPKDDKHFKSSNNHNFIRPASKTISIQPIGSNKIDNVFWNSSKKSNSLNLNDSSSNLNDSVLYCKSDKTVATTNKDIFEMETEPLPLNKHNNIFEMETQVHNKHDESTDSIYTADTQIPGPQESPSIHSLETQLPVPPTEHLPEVCKIHNQQEMHFDLYLANKENDHSIFNAETQMFPVGNKILLNPSNKDDSTSKDKSNVSDEELLFDEVDNEFLEEDFGSQALLPQEISPKIIADNDFPLDETKKKSFEIEAKKRVVRLKSDSSTDCEDFDMALTQKIPEKKVGDDDDATDCEEDFIEINSAKPKNLNDSTKADVEVDLEDIPTQVIGVIESNAPAEVDLEDMPTQVIGVEKNEKDVIFVKKDSINDDIVDLCTQDEYIPNNPAVIKDNEQFSEEIISPFKIPYQSPIKIKRKDILKVTPKAIETKISVKEADDKYYANTQDLYEDLDSQRAMSPEIVPKQREGRGKKSVVKDNTDDEILPSSVEGYNVGDKFPHLENELSPKKYTIADKSSGSSDGEDKVQKFVSNLTSQQIREVIGVTKMRKLPSDCSDVDVTPKKVRPFKLMDIELPDSQEIKTSVTLKTHSLVTESSSESEVENNSEDQHTPILFKKKKKTKPDVKLDLTKKFDVASLPSRVITRVRKPTVKFQNIDDMKIKSHFIKPKLLTEQEDNVDDEIINENLSRLRKHDKSKSIKEKISDVNKKDLKVNEIKSESKKEVHLKKESDKGKKTREKVIKETRNEMNEKMAPLKDETIQMDSVVKTTKKEFKQHKDDTIKLISDNRTTKNEKIQEESILKTNESIEKEENISSRRSIRSSRNKNEDKEKKEKKSKSPKKEVSKKEKTESKPKRTYKRKEKKRDSSPEEDTEVRRSKRHRVATEKKVESINITIKSILKNSSTTAHEQSTDYNISSGSGTDSPKGIKRSAADDSAVPSPKRTRSVATSNTTLRATPARTARTQYVLFTAFPSDEVRIKLEKLGAVIVTDVTACTVVLTIQIKRTFKLLCAVGLGKPIVGPNWVQACADTNMIVDPWLYLIRDEVAEKRFNFSLQRTLSGKRNFLNGYNVSSTPSVMPNAAEMKLIVECSGGTWKDEGPRWVCVSSTADKGLWPLLRRKGATIVSTEFILGGVLKQKLDIYGNKF